MKRSSYFSWYLFPQGNHFQFLAVSSSINSIFLSNMILQLHFLLIIYHLLTSFYVKWFFTFKIHKKILTFLSHLLGIISIHYLYTFCVYFGGYHTQQYSHSGNVQETYLFRRLIWHWTEVICLQNRYFDPCNISLDSTIYIHTIILFSAWLT